MCGEPIRKKRMQDPQIIAARMARSKRNIEKQIRRLKKGQRQWKPIDENELPVGLRNPEERA